MTQWLQAARQATRAATKPTKPTKPPCTLDVEGVLSVLSVLSEGGQSVSDADALPPETADDTFAAFEERTAIREYDGGQPRAEAETAALAEVARATGVTSGTLRLLWAKHPDAVACLAHLSATGPKTCDDVASALHWSRGRAWQAAARLRVAGWVQLDSHGRAETRKKDAQR